MHFVSTMPRHDKYLLLYSWKRLSAWHVSYFITIHESCMLNSGSHQHYSIGLYYTY